MRAGEGGDTEGRGPEGESAFRTVTCLPILPGVGRMSTPTPTPTPPPKSTGKAGMSGLQ